MEPVKIIGAGLAGSEAAWQCARRGVRVDLYEMRPVRSTPAHQTEDFAELVCSNSLKSETEYSAPWLLKKEMRRAGSLLLKCAKETSVPARHALAVGRTGVSKRRVETIESEAMSRGHRGKVTPLDEHTGVTIIATVGLKDPRTGKIPHAVVQLRKENQRADSYNLVGFQNHLKYGEQARVLRLIPGLENAKFLRYGQIHRNTYIDAPTLLTPTLQLRRFQQVFFAGQISGVEGYTESIATGMLAGLYATAMTKGKPLVAAPRESALGSIVMYITHADPKNFQPA